MRAKEEDLAQDRSDSVSHAVHSGSQTETKWTDSTFNPPSTPSNWPSEEQKANQGHNYGTGTLLGQSVGSELLLQSLNDAPGPASPAATLISAPCKRLRDNPPGFQGRDVHSPRPRQSSHWLPLCRAFCCTSACLLWFKSKLLPIFTSLLSLLPLPSGSSCQSTPLR